jgi:hypothetical protein
LRSAATNIYGLTTFEHAGKLKILVATRLELYIVEAVEAYGGVKFRSFPFPTPHNSRACLSIHSALFFFFFNKKLLVALMSLVVSCRVVSCCVSCRVLLSPC